MTECERLIKEGFIPESFLTPETICDFYVGETRKKIWAIEMDLYCRFADVCDRYGFKYWVQGGTLLGAIRHNGFIPWDDDIDVIMPREDYEEFLKTSKDFKHPYFLQTPYTDPGYYVCFSKIRNANTTAITKVFMHQKFNMGIFIDVFPLDSCIPSHCHKDRLAVIPYMQQCGNAMKQGSPYLSPRQKQVMEEFGCENPLLAYQKVQQILSNKEYADSPYWWSGTFTGYPEEKLTCRKTDCGNGLLHKFHHIEVKIPDNWDEILRITYGDYMQFPPKEKLTEWHNFLIFEPDLPYSKYIEQYSK